MDDHSKLKQFKKVQKKIILDYEHDKAYMEWVKLPLWEKFPDGDREPSDYQGFDEVCPEDKINEGGES